jgi:stalled ribosome alternative rescue factor ArfA
MDTQKHQFKAPKIRRRAIELYGHATPFRHRPEKLVKVYNRKAKHPDRDFHNG